MYTLVSLVTVSLVTSQLKRRGQVHVGLCTMGPHAVACGWKGLRVPPRAGQRSGLLLHARWTAGEFAWRVGSGRRSHDHWPTARARFVTGAFGPAGAAFFE